MAGETRQTSDHKVIKAWIEERGGRPGIIRGPWRDEEVDQLRIRFPQQLPGDEPVEPTTWDEFFQTFDGQKMVFVYQHDTPGEFSRYYRFERRDERAHPHGLD